MGVIATSVDLANLALGKVGGAGDQTGASGKITSLADTDQISVWCNTYLPICRQRVISELAAKGAPFPETLKYADLGAEVTADLPDMGKWEYAFELPASWLVVTRQLNQSDSVSTDLRSEYPFEIILNDDGDGYLFLTNDLSNSDNDSAYIEYVFDQTTYAMYSPQLVNAIATILAAELCPMVGKNIEERRKHELEYKYTCIPDAIRANAKRLNGTKVINDYLGGRGQIRVNLSRDYYSLNGVRL